MQTTMVPFLRIAVELCGFTTTQPTLVAGLLIWALALALSARMALGALEAMEHGSVPTTLFLGNNIELLDPFSAVETVLISESGFRIL